MTNPSNTPANLVSVVDEVLKDVNDFVYLRAINSPIQRGTDIHQAKQALLAAFEGVANRVIGEDGSTAAYSQPGMFEINEQNRLNAKFNQLRAAQRQALVDTD